MSAPLSEAEQPAAASMAPVDVGSVNLDSGVNDTHISNHDSTITPTTTTAAITNPPTTAIKNADTAKNGGATSSGNHNNIGPEKDTMVVVVVDPLHPVDQGGCCVCKSNERQDRILLCDGCEGEYHTFCVDPPLRKIPSGAWYCSTCKSEGKGVPKPPPVSAYIGVIWAGTNKANLWQARIQGRGRGEVTIGTYTSQKEAAGAYDKEALKRFGNSTQQNFPDGRWEDASDDVDEPREETKEDEITGTLGDSVSDVVDRNGNVGDRDGAGVGVREEGGTEGVGGMANSESERDNTKEEGVKETRKDAIDSASGGGNGSGNGDAGANDDAEKGVIEREGSADGPDDNGVGVNDIGDNGVGDNGVGVNGGDGGGDDDDHQVGSAANNAEEEVNEQSSSTAGIGGYGGVNRGESGRAFGGVICEGPIDTSVYPGWFNISEGGGAGTSTSGVRRGLSSAERRAQIGSAAAAMVTGGNGCTGGCTAGGGGGMFNISQAGGAGTNIYGGMLPLSSSPEDGRIGAIISDANNGGGGGGSSSVAGGGGDGGGGDRGVFNISQAGGAGTSTQKNPTARAKNGGIRAGSDVDSGVLDMRNVSHTDADVAISETGGDGGDSGKRRQGQGTVDQRPTPPLPPPPPAVRPQLSISIPADAEDALTAEDSASGWSRPETGTRSGSGEVSDYFSSTPASTTGRRQRVKAKWLTEYDDADNADYDAASGRVRKSSARRYGKNATPTSSISRASGAPSASPSHPPSTAFGSGTTGTGAERKGSASMTTPRSDGAWGKRVIPWHGKDWQGRASSKAAVRRIKEKEVVWEVTEDGTLVGEDGNHFFCSGCGEDGEVTCCDHCARVFHDNCLVHGSDSQLAAEHQTEEDPWYCPSCVEAGQTNLVNGRRPIWTQEQRDKGREWEEERSKAAASKAATLASPAVALSGSGASKNKTPKNRPAVSAAKAEGAPAAAAVSASVSVNDDAQGGAPKSVTPVRVFAPELDNLLLRSLLYEVTYKAPAPRRLRGGVGGRGRFSSNRQRNHIPEAPAAPKLVQRPARTTACNSASNIPVPLGALVAHPPVSPRAGLRPQRSGGPRNGPRLGPPFGAVMGPSGILDGTAITFGSRARGPFRAGLALSMVDVGLVPQEIAAAASMGLALGSIAGGDARDSSEKASVRDKEGVGTVRRTEEGLVNPAGLGAGAVVRESNARTAENVEQARGDSNSSYPQGGAVGGGGRQGKGYWNAVDATRDLHRPWSSSTSNGGPRPMSAKKPMSEDRHRQTMTRPEEGHAGGEGSFFGNGRRRAGSASPRANDSWKGKGRGGGSDPWGGDGGGSGSRSARASGRSGWGGSHGGGGRATGDRMDVDDGEEEGYGGRAERGRDDTARLDPNRIRRIPSSAGFGASSGGGSAKKSKREKEEGAALTKQSRIWNRKHIRTILDEGGKTDVCSYCRSHPDNHSMMACPDMPRSHTFCFPCLLKKHSIVQEHITKGKIKWECPTCRQRKERPARVSKTPSSLRGSAWEGGGLLTSPGASIGPGTEQPATGGSSFGRSRESDGGSVAGPRGLKRSFPSVVEAPGAQDASSSGGWRPSPLSSSPRGFASSSGVEGSGSGGEPHAFRRDVSARDGHGDGDGGDGFPHDVEGLAPTIRLARKRLVRLVSTLALDRLQQLDPLDLFKDPVPAGVKGYTDAIKFPIDFSTMRRRVQWDAYASVMDLAADVRLLCSNAKIFNSSVSVWYAMASTILEGAERLWPQAQDLLDCLLAAEMKAAEHNLRGPASSSDVWALDGHFAGFGQTPANEDAYYMHIAIRRAAAATRARAAAATAVAGEKGKKPTDVKNDTSVGVSEKGAETSGKAFVPGVEDCSEMILTGVGVGCKRKNRESGVDFDAEMKAAVFTASSPALLYTRGQMGDEERLLRESLSDIRTDQKELALRRTTECAKCNPIDDSAVRTQKQNTQPPPTPVTRQEAAQDGEFVAVASTDGSGHRSAPLGPNPKLGGKKQEKNGRGKGEESAMQVVVPEWKVLNTATQATRRNGEEAARHVRTFGTYFAEVHARSGMRLRVDRSPVQGLGVFAKQDIRAHELVAEYVGERLKRGEAEERAAKYGRTKVTDLIVRLDDETFIDATRKGNISRFFNHSCAPNCYMRTVVAGKEASLDKRVCFFSLRDIHLGEEISYAYPAPHKVGLGAVVALECSCRAPGCRGRISSREQL